MREGWNNGGTETLGRATKGQADDRVRDTRSVSERSDGPLGWEPDFLIEHACLTVRDLLLACPEASRKPTAAKLITSLTGAAPDWEDGLRRSSMEGLNGKRS